MALKENTQVTYKSVPALEKFGASQNVLKIPISQINWINSGQILIENEKNVGQPR